jgi:hypothetical protein
MGRANHIILFICRCVGDAVVQIFYSLGMLAWGGLITLSCLFVGIGGRCSSTDIILCWYGMGRANHIILFICRCVGDTVVQIFYSLGMLAWGGLITLSCLFVGMEEMLQYIYYILLVWYGEG